MACYNGDDIAFGEVNMNALLRIFVLLLTVTAMAPAAHAVVGGHLMVAYGVCGFQNGLAESERDTRGCTSATGAVKITRQFSVDGEWSTFRSASSNNPDSEKLRANMFTAGALVYFSDTMLNPFAAIRTGVLRFADRNEAVLGVSGGVEAFVLTPALGIRPEAGVTWSLTTTDGLAKHRSLLFARIGLVFRWE